ncbi:MAG: outer membrane protein transport protein [Acidobacteria bacterium]|nr:outer membrane protein transport protein [Acidobacteriota bacterium]
MKTRMRLFLAVVLAAGLTTGLFANGLNLNGNGSKANAMGGAFVGLANDFSAAYWNPAGLAQMTKASFSLFGADILPFGTYTREARAIDAKSTFKHYLIPALGYFQPIGDKLVVGIYLNAPSGAGAEWDGADLTNITGIPDYDWKSKLGIFTISPSIAVKITDQIMLGATLDVNYGMLAMAQPILWPLSPYSTQYSEDLKGWAVGGTFGLLVKPVKQFSFGVTYKLPFTAKLKGDVTIPAAVGFGLPATDTGTRTATWPQWLAAGIAVKPTDKLTFTADVQYTNWEKLQTIPVTFVNAGWQAALAPGAAYELLWKDTTQFRFGVEYMASKCLALRAGYYFDPNPGPIETQNILLPEFKYNWITAGFGYMSEKIAIDFSVEYGKGASITVPGEGDMPGVHGMTIVAPSLSFTYKF